MSGKIAVCALATILLTTAPAAQAQPQAKIPRIGYVSGTGDATNQGPYVEALRQGLRDLGYVEGKNFVIEFRGAEGKVEPIPSIVARKSFCSSLTATTRPTMTSGARWASVPRA